MLKTTELDDVKQILKSYTKYGFANQNDMDTALAFVAVQVELKLKDSNLVGLYHYDYVKSLNGVYSIIEYSFLYWAEVYAIAYAFVGHAIGKNIKGSSGFSISLPDYSESVTGNTWYDNDKIDLRNNYIENMYSAGYKINSVRI